MIPMDGNICTPKVRSKWFSFNNVRAIFKISSCLNLNILLHFTHFPYLHHKENISDMYNHECVLYHVSLYPVWLYCWCGGCGATARDPVTGIVRGYPRRGRIGLHTLHSAPPRVRVLGCRCSVTIRGPGPSHWTRPFIRTSGTRPGCSSETRSKF